MNAVTDRLDSVATQDPSRIAIEYAGQQVTYRELAAQVDQWVRMLRTAGCHGTPVLVAATPTDQSVAAILGIFKAGAQFVPLHRDWPTSQLSAIISQTGARLALVDADVAAAHQPTFSQAGIEIRGLHRPSPTSAAELSASTPTEKAYLYFTSGSTGTPKGVVGSHTGLAHFLDWEAEQFQVGPGWRTSLLTNMTFDPFLRDLLLPLTSGATLCIPAEPSLLLDPTELGGWLSDQRINLIHLVPTLFRQLLRAGLPAQAYAELRVVGLAGEPLRGDDLALAAAGLPDQVQIANLYGPTETTLATCCHLVRPADAGRSVVPIGRPLPGSSIRVLAADGTECQPGETGELVIETAHGSHGYFADPKRTAAAFVPTGRPGWISYCTGDLGHVDPEGLLVCQGRADDQLKIRGMKVVATEVEQAICALPGVRQAAAFGVEGRDGLELCCAFAGAPSITPAELRAALRDALPPHAVPTRWTRYDALPTLTNGKIDRRQLRATAASQAAAAPAGSAPASSPAEQLIGLWQEVLGSDEIDLDSDLLTSGGHSLAAARLATAIRGDQGGAGDEERGAAAQYQLRRTKSGHRLRRLTGLRR